LSSLTTKERFEAVFKFEQPDVIPISSWLCNDAITNYYAGETLTIENAHEVLPKALRKTLDLVYQKDDQGELFVPEREHLETDELGYTHQYMRWTSWVVDYPYPPKDTKSMANTIRREIDLFNAWNGQNANEIIQRVDHLQTQLGDNTLVSGRTFIITGPGINYRDGLENFSYFLADFPDIHAEWIEARHAYWLRKIDLLEDGSRYPIVMVAGDLAYKTGLLVSPNWLRASGWFQRLTEIVDAYHQKGIKVLYHSDGNLNPILPDLIATGIDALNPIETAASMELGEIREAFGNHLVLSGGIPYEVLLNGTPEDVRRVTKKCLQAAAPGYIAGSSSDEFSDDMTLENFLAMKETIDTWKP
jgi:hypothetical protein